MHVYEVSVARAEDDSFVVKAPTQAAAEDAALGEGFDEVIDVRQLPDDMSDFSIDLFIGYEDGDELDGPAGYDDDEEDDEEDDED